MNVTLESGVAERKAMGCCKNIETFQVSSKDRRPSRTLEQEEEVPFLEANWFMLTMATYFGFHSVKRSSSGALKISYWKLLAALLHLTIGILGFLVVQSFYIIDDLDYYQRIMLLPILFGCGFCVEGSLSAISLSKRYIDYVSEIEAQNVRMKSFKNMPFIAAALFLSTTIYTVCTFLVTNLSTEIIVILVIPVFHSSFLPHLLDVCMFSFNLMLNLEVIKLRERMSQIKEWTNEEVSGVASQWLLLCKLFKRHNKVELFFLLSLTLILTLSFFLSLSLSFFLFFSLSLSLSLSIYLSLSNH